MLSKVSEYDISSHIKIYHSKLGKIFFLYMVFYVRAMDFLYNVEQLLLSETRNPRDDGFRSHLSGGFELQVVWIVRIWIRFHTLPG